MTDGTDQNEGFDYEALEQTIQSTQTFPTVGVLSVEEAEGDSGATATEGDFDTEAGDKPTRKRGRSSADRIGQLTKNYREEERRRKAIEEKNALLEAQLLERDRQLALLQSAQSELELTRAQESVPALKARLAAARDAGDVDEEFAVTEQLASLVQAKTLHGARKSMYEEEAAQLEQKAKAAPAKQQQESAQPELGPEALEFLKDNQWVVKPTNPDEVYAAALAEAVAKEMEAEGYDLAVDDGDFVEEFNYRLKPKLQQRNLDVLKSKYNNNTQSDSQQEEDQEAQGNVKREVRSAAKAPNGAFSQKSSGSMTPGKKPVVKLDPIASAIAEAAGMSPSDVQKYWVKSK